MATRKEIADDILAKLGHPGRFDVRAMFGEYALYSDGKVVALICDNQLYVKIMPQSAALEEVCEKSEPYPGAKPYYLVEEHQLVQLRELPDVLLRMAAALPAKKVKKRRTS